MPSWSRFASENPAGHALSDPTRFAQRPGVKPAGQLSIVGSGTVSCLLPRNPRAGQPGVNDPYFATNADRAAWMAANPTCVAPPTWQPESTCDLTQYTSQGNSWTSDQRNQWIGNNPGCPPPPAATDTPNPPAQVSPDNGSVVTPGGVVFSWTPNSSGETSRIRVCSGPNGTGTCTTTQANPGDTSMTISMTPGSYYWSISALAPGGAGGWGAFGPDRKITVGSPAAPAVMSLADCQQAKQQFAKDNSSNTQLVIVGSTGGDIPMAAYNLTPAGEAAFSQLYQSCAALMNQCKLPWDPGGTGSFSYRDFGIPGVNPTPTWNSEADRQAWMAAHPACGVAPQFILPTSRTTTVVSAPASGVSSGTLLLIGGLAAVAVYFASRSKPSVAASRSSRTTTRSR